MTFFFSNWLVKYIKMFPSAHLEYQQFIFPRLKLSVFALNKYLISVLDKGEERGLSFGRYFFSSLAESYFHVWRVRGELVKVLFCELATENLFHQKTALSRNFISWKFSPFSMFFISKLAASETTLSHCQMVRLTKWIIQINISCKT